MKKKIFTVILIIVYLFGLAPIGSANMSGAKVDEAIFSDENEVLGRLQSQQKSLSAGEQNLVDKKLKNQQAKDLKENFNKFLPAAKANNDFKQSYVKGEVLVKFKDQKINLRQSSGAKKARLFAENKNLDKKEDIKKSNISVLKSKSDESVEEMVERLKNDPDVEYAQPNFQYYPLSIDANDTYKDLLWGLDNANDYDIDAPEAWEISEGGENDVIVAVIDSGVAYNHPDLQANMWDGSNCVDENGNALGGCNHGYDYEDNDLTPLPASSSHGTHIAGTIGAVKNNGKGIIGVAPNIKIMAVKSGLTTVDIVNGINFAKYNRAKAINASWG
ncbi:MAG: S8 family serine peptidase, partial [bacterium]